MVEAATVGVYNGGDSSGHGKVVVEVVVTLTDGSWVVI